MKKPFTDFYLRVIKNIVTIINIKGLSHTQVAEMSGITLSSVSKYLSLQQALSLDNLSKLANVFGMREIDIITYPRILKSDQKDDDPVEAILQIRLAKDKKDQVMRLVFGDNNLEIINK